MAFLIVPLTKSPWPAGRIGPQKLQDWFISVRIAVRLQRTLPESAILIASNLHVEGQPSEQECYDWALKQAGAANGTVMRECRAYETVEQLAVADELARAHGDRVVIISTFTHYLRVRWLCRGKNYKHYAAWGIPRPRDVLTDAVLTILFPLMQMTGTDKVFCELIKKSRTKGRF